ncbi:GUN4 domain-containing protein [Leptolyngbya sp. FACHB-541]|uniref:caspase, EACC1-associated type n=1 Tax=Leptolyngbya sp. FACHB-541 TaxID=2692810 RepID=UPI001686E34B|nr:GUN4 domain-containing protein [Leptolyngbya sp. FACHB-541]MBD1999088.1 GUN4 domain-containing protein [Leptolyngbya sp. FACHB-541]
MAKVALLIGVSNYGDGLASLPGPQTDIQEMQRVLQNPKVSEFDVVALLPNPDPFEMQLAIEKLFSENRSRDDLILLYFSGHGVKADDGTLYFATRVTQKNQQGRIFASTAVSSSFIQTCMSQSCSKRQVLILDCCFSGAFANDMKAKQAVDEAIDVKTQLGGEGRAVLTSSTATQVSYEKEGISIYTRYLVQGLETGAADRDSNGQITVDELHEYAKEKVQEAAPTMQPEIYAVREGYKILIAQAPQDDPKLIYRKELDERAKLKRGKLSPIDHRAFDYRRRELGLSVQEAEQITNEVLQPYQEFWEKLNEFEQAVKETLDYDPVMSPASLDDLRYLQRVLKLRDEDIAPILSVSHVSLTSSEHTPSESVELSLSTRVTSISTPSFLENDLSSQENVDYTNLRGLLANGDWRKADEETYLIMIYIIGKRRGDWFTEDELLRFPCTDLRTIDRLWVNYSHGKFGFSVQKQIYVDCGAKLNGKYPGDRIWEQFCDRTGWRWNNTYITPHHVTYDVITASQGHLPAFGMIGGFWLGVIGTEKFSSLALRLVDCKIM